MHQKMQAQSVEPIQGNRNVEDVLCVKEMLTGSSILSAMCAKNSFALNIVEKKKNIVSEKHTHDQ